MDRTIPSHLNHVQKTSTIINRSQMLLHFIALMALFHYRLSFLSQKSESRDMPIIPWLLIFASELLLSFLWFLYQAFRWRPVSRTIFLEHLPENENLLPGVDVFICTADPGKEPVLEVMNTVLSAMALDYPPGKLSVYLSDDSGSSSTLYALKAAFGFARVWLPFCRIYGIKTRCPAAYFSSPDDFADIQDTEFLAEGQKIKGQYEVLQKSVKGGVEKAEIISKSINTNHDHPQLIEILDDKLYDASDVDNAKLPLLVYVAREKKSSQPHHFKAGALNVLLRVSGVISNAPYILVLDCDMYCNDPSSAKQAMCFHLDTRISNSLAFVQFPQRFYNIAKNDIYDSQLRSLFTTQWEGMDGLLGPALSGTGFYMKREALYGGSIVKDADTMKLKQSFGPCNEFINSLDSRQYSSNGLLQDTQLVASCTFEHQTQWGEEVGFLYHSVVEDYFTGFILHCKGWTSVFHNPSRPQFLGSATTNLNDILTQQTRWYSGLLGAGISKFCPLVYGTLRMSFLESMCYASVAFVPLYCLPILCLATIPQLCLLNGVSVFPEASNPLFIIYTFIFISSLLRHMHEVILAEGSVQTWWNEQRMWMIKSLTSYLYGSLEALLNNLGMKNTNFLPTNKVPNEEQVKLYEMGKIDFHIPSIFLVAMVFVVVLNLVSLLTAVSRMIVMGGWDKLFLQVCMSLFGLVMGWPIIEGMILRGKGSSIDAKVILISTVFVMVFLSMGSILLNFQVL